MPNDDTIKAVRKCLKRDEYGSAFSLLIREGTNESLAHTIIRNMVVELAHARG